MPPPVATGELHLVVVLTDRGDRLVEVVVEGLQQVLPEGWEYLWISIGSVVDISA